MFCPKCRVEYRRGFTRCADCDVDLVDVLTEEDHSSDEALTTLWECDSESECVDVCEELKSADIRYHVVEIPHEKTARMGVTWHYQILISKHDLDQAKALLSIDAPQNTISSSDTDDEEVVDPAVELADVNVPDAEPRRSDTYLEPWHPEDATVRVWLQDGDDLSEGIERALDANYIHSRCESAESGVKDVFVRPEDESFAREIVREIVEGTPRK